MRRVTLSYLVVILMSSVSLAQYNPFANTPFDPSTYSDLDPNARGSAANQIFNPGSAPQIQGIPQQQGLRFFNQTQAPIFVAVAYLQPGSSGMLGDGTSFNAPTPPSWHVRGWFRVNPNSATTVIPGALTNRFFYYYANSANGEAWEGTDSYYSIQPTNEFDYRVGAAPAYGTVLKGFRKLDTGPSATSYTLNLR